MTLLNNCALFVSKRRWLNRIVRNFLPLLTEVEITRHFRIFTDPTDLYGPSFYVNYGGAAAFYHYEEELKAEIAQHLKANDIFFDRGANIGLISLFVHKFFPQVQIHSFEPADVTFHCLGRTLELNNISNINLIKKGIGDRNGLAQFFIDPLSNGGSSLVRDHYGKPIEIDLITMDQYIESTQQIPSLIKVDVEGAEEYVLKGGAISIQKYRPIMIIEADNQKLLENLELWVKSFEGYNFRPVGSRSLSEIKLLGDVAQSMIDNKKMTIDYLFVPKK